MDPSALIFVALAVAWAVYLIPKALEHHEESLRSRTVSSFSRSMRVLARREPRGKGKGAETDLVAAPRKKTPKPAKPAAKTPAAPTQRYVEVPVELSAEQLRARRAATHRATRRRRNVLGVLLLALVAVGVLALTGVVATIWAAGPVVLLAAWLVACRLMVRKEHRLPTMRVPVADDAPVVDPETGEVVAVADSSGSAEAPAETIDVDADASAEGRWDPVQAPLPTYVSKPAARRTVRTIDLDSTGVWSSGRSASDSALAREAEASERSAREAAQRLAQERRRASGS